MGARAASAAQTRVRILDASRDLFLAHPYGDVTLQRIADAAGVSLPTVALHFGSKEGLLSAAVERFRPQEDAAREVLPGDVDTAVRVVCARYEELGPATMRFLALEEGTPAVRPLLDAGRASHRDWVERTFAGAIRRAGAQAARRRRAMQLLAATDLYTWHVLRRVLGPDDTVRAMADTVHAIVGADGARKKRRGS